MCRLFHNEHSYLIGYKMINIVQQLPINSRTSEVLCESGLQLKVLQVGYAQTIYDAVIIFKCVASDTGEEISFVAFSDNTVHLEDRDGNAWDDKVIAVTDDMGYPIYSTQARSVMLSWIQSANQYGALMMMLMLGSVIIATQNIYVAIPFLGIALLALLGWAKEYKNIKQVFRVWGEPDTLTM